MLIFALLNYVTVLIIAFSKKSMCSAIKSAVRIKYTKIRAKKGQKAREKRLFMREREEEKKDYVEQKKRREYEGEREEERTE